MEGAAAGGEAGIGGVHGLIVFAARAIEYAGVAVIVGGTLLALVLFLRDGGRSGWTVAYEHMRTNLGRAILLGLELLVGADIIATITAPLTWETVGLLGLVVLIRTFLSFSLETEMEGCWPWARARMEREGKAEAR